MLTLMNLALRRGRQQLFSGANLSLRAGERCGLVGANGCGKSSLFSAILGELDVDTGDIQFIGDPVIAHVAQETPADPRAAIEYVLDGDQELRDIQSSLLDAEQAGQGERIATLHGRLEAIGGYGAEARAAQLIHGLGFVPGDERRPVTSYSGGWRMRLNLARALMCRSDLLLLDEPTNHLDLDAVIWLQRWLENYQGGLLLISHDRDFLDRATNRIAHIENDRLTVYTGNYAAFEAQRAARLEQQQDAYQRQQQELTRIRSFIDRFRAKATKARQAQSRIKALERMELITPVNTASAFRFRFQDPPKLPNPLLNLDGVDCGYADATVLHGVALSLSPGDRIGLLGRNGAGKSTLVRTIAGDLPGRGGERTCAQDLRIGYFAQHQLEQLDGAATPLLHLQRLDPRAREQQLRDFLGGFGFPGEMATSVVAPLSGGERARLALAMVVYQRPNLLLLDEPTNHLDLDMRDALAMALQDYSGALVVIAHDRHLLRSATDRLLLVSGGRVSEFDGDLDDYAAWLTSGERTVANSGQRDEESASGNSAVARKEQRRLEAARRQALQPLRQSVRKHETLVERLQAESAELEQQLADPAIYDPGAADHLQQLLQQQATTTSQLEQAEEAWMEALQRLEEAEGEPERAG
ncbi:ATP-binding cassette subfamily F protein 3 [Natronocella acetinitrilica]|uniref:Probable ATP-binding protein YheS n=1 Tax=Natronocella acetinitrilica TaxID=414046 RepID=A0AAE3KC97_9GAMM|nr:ATP-binding cassette domain-containing protein [Natronocella acetinitrilica]MCP1675529.1 ATP-binding cassette subfamily F protein 3 [Natronocella acetinitrilica]